MFEIILLIAIALVAGIICSLVPGLHINLISSIIFSLSQMQNIEPFKTSIIIFVIAVSYSFINFIPSVYLGVPNPDNVLTIHPLHRYLLKGKGHEGLALVLIGSFVSLILIIILFPLLLRIIPFLYEKIKELIAILLISISLFLIFKEKHSKFMALLCFILSGLFGLVSLNIKNINEPLLPILSGLFGLPALFISIYYKNEIPEQKTTFPSIKPRLLLKSASTSLISSIFFILLPGLGPSQVSILGKYVSKLKTKGFLMLSGGLNISNLFLSLITFYTINKERNGPIVIISKLIAEKDISLILYLIFSSLFIIAPLIFSALTISKAFSKIILKINYTIICLLVMIFIISIVVLISKFIGLLILIIGFLIGLIPILTNINRNHLMGVLILPIILFFI